MTLTLSDDPTPIDQLLGIMTRLRSRDGGCPWDLKQTFETIATYTIEEAYEVRDAIQRGNRMALKDELGDLLFQVVFHAQIAAEEGAFTFDDVIAAICDKMIRRHPHVFGDTEITDADTQTEAWERQKAAERATKANGAGSVLDDVPAALPALQRAEKLQKRAARVGFDWPDITPVIAKLDEERAELDEATASGDRDRMTDELGDVLFAVTNLARHLGLDPEESLRQTNDKFTRRFNYIESTLKQNNESVEAASLARMEALWQEAKASEVL
jgi:MazG family protein